MSNSGPYVFQYSILPPVLPASTNDFAESSSGTYTKADSLLPQAKKQISHETVQSYCDNGICEWKSIKMEQTDFQGADSKIAAECRTDGNSTSTNSHENIPHRSADRSVNFTLFIFFSFVSMDSIKKLIL